MKYSLLIVFFLITSWFREENQPSIYLNIHLCRFYFFY